jgi:hypothetical protein
MLTGTSSAHASSDGRRNTPLALGTGAIFSLLKGKTTQGLILGAGTAYAYKRYQDAQTDGRGHTLYYNNTTRSYRSPG